MSTRKKNSRARARWQAKEKEHSCGLLSNKLCLPQTPLADSHDKGREKWDRISHVGLCNLKEIKKLDRLWGIIKFTQVTKLTDQSNLSEHWLCFALPKKSQANFVIVSFLLTYSAPVNRCPAAADIWRFVYVNLKKCSTVALLVMIQKQIMLLLPDLSFSGSPLTQLEVSSSKIGNPKCL